MTNNTRAQFVICTTARSGSNLFCSFLRNTKVLGLPIEAFNPDAVRKSGFGRLHESESSLSVSAYIDWIQKYHRTKNGVFGTKLLYEDFESFRVFPSFHTMLKDSTLIHLRRRSKIRQAISYYFAETTGQWVASDAAVADPAQVPFDFDKINTHINRLVMQDSMWTTILNGLEAPYCEVYFEDFIKDPNYFIDLIMKRLALPAMEVPVFSEMKEQASPRSKDFSSQFSDELRRRLFETSEEQRYKNCVFRP